MPDQLTRPDNAPADEPEEGGGTAVATETGTRVAADKELELYRSLVDTPTEFKNGFTWTVIAGAIFCGLLMMPGSIYLSLMTGGMINASWVTLLIFSEVARRSLKTLIRQEMVVLLSVAGAMSLGGPVADLIYRQYFIGSDAVRDAGLLGQFPAWYAPQPGSESILTRTLWHGDWLVPVLLMVFTLLIGRIKSFTLGYFFFRLTSDVERLPFPFAPIQAQGAMALAESNDKQATSWKWRVFSIGTVLGLVFAFVQIGIPLFTGAVMPKAITLIPLPWWDATTLTEGLLPATPVGMVVDLGLLLIGMVIPFWSMIGAGCALVLTMIMNPILHHFGVLHRWQPGMDTVATSFSNGLDFWMVFGIGVMFGVAVISVYQSVRDLVRQLREARNRRVEYRSETSRRENIWGNPHPDRGDFSPWLALAIYFVTATLLIYVTHLLIPKFPVYFMVLFVYIYTPFITYLNARLIAINGQQVEIPMLRQGAFILSGYKGVDIWLAPVPMDNYGAMAQGFRVNELTGTNFWSYIKADLVVVPLSFVLSFAFWAFIWHSGAIPSEKYPFAQKMWDLRAKNDIVMMSATMDTGGAEPLFFQAMKPNVPGGGWTVGGAAFLFTILAFLGLSAASLPTMAIYGFIWGLGQMPHGFIVQIIGAFLGKYYFQKRFGEVKFLQMAPVLVAGYSTGIGLIALLGVAVNLITNAVSASPF